jgi:hypothetical protein
MYKMDKETNQFTEFKNLNLKNKKAVHNKLPHRTKEEKWAMAY